MKKQSYLSIMTVALMFMASANAGAQGVGINPTGNAPDPSAALDIDFTNKGMLVPRVSLISTGDVATVPSPVTSLLVYNTNASMAGGGGTGFYYWDGTQWKAVGGNAEGSSCTGAPATPGSISGDPAVCKGGIGTYFIAPVTDAATYTWTYTGTGAAVSGTTNLVVISFSSTATSGNLSVTATNACGTSSGSATFAVTTNNSPNSNFTPGTTTPPLGTNVTFTPQATDNQLYFWTFNGPPTVTSTVTTPTFTMPQTFEVTTVTLSVTKNGCTSSTTTSITTPYPTYPPHGTQTFNAIRQPQAFIVPDGVSSVIMDVCGASGYNPWISGGDSRGGEAVGTLAVTPGQILYIYVGGYYQAGNFTASGEAGNNRGGDASSVRTPGGTLADRVIVAGGGGGLGYNNQSYAAGGHGGGSTGASGSNGSFGCTGGAGGGQASGGVGGNAGSGGTLYPGNPGQLGAGGMGGSPYTNGGGGGGYYGGGSGGANSQNGSAGGGGGSNYLSPSLTNTSSFQGNQPQSSDGKVTITW